MGTNIPVEVIAVGDKVVLAVELFAKGVAQTDNLPIKNKRQSNFGIFSTSDHILCQQEDCRTWTNKNFAEILVFIAVLQ